MSNSVEKFEGEIESIKGHMMNRTFFCEEVCKACSGNSENCAATLFLKARNLESAKKSLQEQLRNAKSAMSDLINSRKRPSPHKKTNGYIKLKKLSLGTILPMIGQPKRYVVTKEVSVSVGGVRLETFKRNITCVECGIVGTHFWAESNDNDNSYHLNLYATLPDGREVLMTRDHIMPKSRGGSERLENMQTMCTTCNTKKGNKIPKEVGICCVAR